MKSLKNKAPPVIVKKCQQKKISSRHRYTHEDYFENILHDDKLFASILKHDTKKWSDCINVYKHFYPDPIDVLIEKSRKEFLYNDY
jgi:hypothetical protein